VSAAGPAVTADDATYPPHRHALRDLPFSMEAVDPERSRARLAVTPEQCVGGRLAAGPLMTVVDVLAGSLVGRVLAPDWMATAQMSLHLGDPPADGQVVADATVVRNGRTTVVVEVLLSAEGHDGPSGADRPCGEAMLTFVRLPRRDTNLDLSGFEVRFGEPTTFALADSGLTASWDDAIGARVLDAATGRIVVDVGPYVRNSFGAVNGGVVASVADVAARALASSSGVAPVRTTDVVVHYLTQGRVGPLSTVASVVRDGPTGTLVRVEVRDDGDPGPGGRPRVMVVAHVQCEPLNS
jgi:acyl-coenzyme A thioesterase PaaI-like protein